MLEGLLGGLGSFAKSGLGQSVIGAGLGYGLDRLSGGKGGTGGLLGGLLGGANAFTSNGGFMGQDAFAGSVADGAMNSMSGLFGQQGRNVKESGLATWNNPSIAENIANTGNVGVFANSPSIAENIANTGNVGVFANNANNGLLSGLSGYGDLIKGGTDLTNAYGQYQTGREEKKKNQAEIDYLNSIRASNQMVSDRNFANQAATQAGLLEGFNRSGLAQPSSYYSS